MSEEKAWYDLVLENGKRLLDLSKVFAWFRGKFRGNEASESDEKSTPGILIIGPGGTGKTTLARLLSGQNIAWLFKDSWNYLESYGEESYSLSTVANVEIVVPAGQKYRRAASWNDIRTDISEGRYSGVIVVGAYGYHTYSGVGYQKHKLYKGNKDEFRRAYVDANRTDEASTLEFLRPALEDAPGKIWLMTVITKQDLWYQQQDAVQAFYTSGVWADYLRAIMSKRGEQAFHTETVFLSLLAANLEDPEGDVLFKTVAGYDARKQIESVERLLTALNALMTWEAT